MRIVVFGGTDLTLAIAKATEGHLAGVITIPPQFRISYRPDGLPNVRYRDIAAWATSRSIPSLEWSGADKACSFIDEVTPDWGIAAGWFYLLPERVLDRFANGVAGLHPSLLPKYRGNAPLNWAILNGDTQTGVSLFRLTPGIDDGPLYAQEAFPINQRSTIADLIRQTEEISIRLVRQALAGEIELRDQHGSASYALARTPEDGNVDWHRPAVEIDRLVRATTSPYQGAFTFLGDERITIWAGEPVRDLEVMGAPGQLFCLAERPPLVVCGEGTLYAITEAQGADGIDAMTLLHRSSQQRLS